MKLILLSVLKILALAIGLLLVAQCGSPAANKQGNQSNAPSPNAAVPAPADEGKIVAEVPKYEKTGPDLKAMLKVPRPRVTVGFGGGPTGSIDLPAEAQPILDVFWSEAIKAANARMFEKPANGQAGQQRDMEWFKKITLTQFQLTQITIDAPAGKRNLSQTEATEVCVTLNKAAVEVVKNSR